MVVLINVKALTPLFGKNVVRGIKKNSSSVITLDELPLVWL
jgi:hypothetical protein